MLHYIVSSICQAKERWMTRSPCGRHWSIPVMQNYCHQLHDLDERMTPFCYYDGYPLLLAIRLFKILTMSRQRCCCDCLWYHPMVHPAILPPRPPTNVNFCTHIHYLHNCYHRMKHSSVVEPCYCHTADDDLHGSPNPSHPVNDG